jgi:hypothetical protein
MPQFVIKASVREQRRKKFFHLPPKFFHGYPISSILSAGKRRKVLELTEWNF